MVFTGCRVRDTTTTPRRPRRRATSRPRARRAKRRGRSGSRRRPTPPHAAVAPRRRAVSASRRAPTGRGRRQTTKARRAVRRQRRRCCLEEQLSEKRDPPDASQEALSALERGIRRSGQPQSADRRRSFQSRSESALDRERGRRGGSDDPRTSGRMPRRPRLLVVDRSPREEHPTSSAQPGRPAAPRPPALHEAQESHHRRAGSRSHASRRDPVRSWRQHQEGRCQVTIEAHRGPRKVSPSEGLIGRTPPAYRQGSPPRRAHPRSSTASAHA
jgi:hypothetical protein